MYLILFSLSSSVLERRDTKKLLLNCKCLPCMYKPKYIYI